MEIISPNTIQEQIQSDSILYNEEIENGVCYIAPAPFEPEPNTSTTLGSLNPLEPLESIDHSVHSHTPEDLEPTPASPPCADPAESETPINSDPLMAIQTLWASGTQSTETHYSVGELNRMVLRSAQRSIRRLYPGWIIGIACLVCVVYLGLKIAGGVGGWPLMTLHALLISIILVAQVVAIVSQRKINRYNPNISVKEWIGSRITSLERGILFRRRYGVLIYGSQALFVVGITFFNIYFAQGFVAILPFGLGITVGLTAAFVLGGLLAKRLRRTKEKLEKLYEQI